jgi:hypothetical protein
MDNRPALTIDCRLTQAVGAVFGLHMIASNLTRLGNLLEAQPSPQEEPAMAAAANRQRPRPAMLTPESDFGRPGP